MSRTGQLIAAVAAVAILATLGLTAISPPPVAADSNDWIVINQWGYVINDEGKYRVGAQLIAPANVGLNDAAIRIVNAKDVELDINGQTIHGKANPNDFRMGNGVGISVENSEDVKIRSNGGEITRCGIALKISHSKDVEFDVNGMRLRRNTHGIQVFGQSKKIKLEDFSTNNEKYIDVFCNETDDVKIKKADIVGGSQTGVAIWNSKDVDIKDSNIGKVKLDWGVVVKDSEKTDIEDSEFNRCQTAVTLQGSGTKDTEIRKCKFGQRFANQCDLRVTQGAEEPDLHDNEPDNLIRCN